MYEDRGYGSNWEPDTATNARRFNSSTRSYVILAGLFIVGFVLIIIVVLSLIPVFIAREHRNPTNNLLFPKLLVQNYRIEVRSDSNDFSTSIWISQQENRDNLRAALTSILQNENSLVGSIVEIDSGKNIRRKRTTTRQQMPWLTISINLRLISGQTCSNTVCLNNYQNQSTFALTNVNRPVLTVRYRSTNTSSFSWLDLKLPKTIDSNVTFDQFDPNFINSTLSYLLKIDENFNRRPTNVSELFSVGSTPIHLSVR